MNPRLSILAILFSLLSVHFNQGTPDTLSLDVARELASPVAVAHRSGRHFEGQLERTSPTTVSITVKAGEGEVVYTVERQDILEITFPGESIELQIEERLLEEDFSGALPFLEALYKQRSAYLDLLDGEEVARFLPLALAYRMVGRPAEAIAVSNHLHTLSKSGEFDKDLTEIVLLSQYDLRPVEESARLALGWIQKAPRYHSSALGWWILAKISFAKGDFRSALWISLHPVVFSSHLPMNYLAECYALSIASAVSLDRSDEALKLYQEMTERGLAWPQDPEMLPYRERIATFADGL